MADIRGITLSNSAALHLQVRDVERALSAPRPADALAPESVRQQLADLEARGALPLAAFREAQESAERLQVWARETLGDLAPDFSRLRQLLALLPGRGTDNHAGNPSVASASASSRRHGYG